VEGSSVTARDYGFHELRAQHPGVPAAVATVAVVPRGTLAVVTRDWRGDSIVIVDLDGSNRRRIATGSDVNGLAWTPDGTRLVASLGKNFDERRLHSVTLDGVLTPLPIGVSPVYQVSPVFSADGKWLFFASESGIARARPDGSGLQRFAVPDFFASDVGPSPDGSRVAAAPGGTAFGLIYGIETGAVTYLRGVEVGSLRWSPKGNLLAFNGRERGVGLMAPDGSNLQLITGWINSRDLRLDWSPDGKWIVFHGGTDLELIQVETGRRIPLRHMSWHLQPAWRP
jgi:Tol biopolymer transport system component